MNYFSILSVDFLRQAGAICYRISKLIEVCDTPDFLNAPKLRNLLQSSHSRIASSGTVFWLYEICKFSFKLRNAYSYCRKERNFWRMTFCNRQLWHPITRGYINLFMSCHISKFKLKLHLSFDDNHNSLSFSVHMWAYAKISAIFFCQPCTFRSNMYIA